MHLIEPLVSGIRGAENGTVTLLQRGTSSVVSYYKDFEASQLYDGTQVQLDSFGSVTLYVDRLVDVLVYDWNGVLVREFVAGVEDAAVEVISPSFTGVDYKTGEVGAQKPTDLQKVLDAWSTSSGTTDWKVIVDGLPITLQAALATTSLFFNVKKFGALGNGIADDRTAIVSAINAAGAVFGGIVYFPPGVYRITSSITLSGSIGLLGNSGKSTMIALDAGPGNSVLTLGPNGAGALSLVQGIWIGLINQGGGHTLISAVSGSGGEFHFVDCVIGAVAFNYAFGYRGDTTSSGLKVIFERCYCRTSSPSAAPPPFLQTGLGTLTIRDCEVITDATSATSLVSVETNATITGNRFSAPSIGAAAVSYIVLADSAAPNPIIVTANYFAPCFASAGSSALRNNRVKPAIGWLEHSNVFGSMVAANPGLIPYSFATDGFVPTATELLQACMNGSRVGRVEAFIVAPSSTATLNPKAFGMSHVVATSGGGSVLTLNANKGSMSDRWLLNVINATGGAAISVVAGTNIQWPGGQFNVNPGLSLLMEMTWDSTTAGSGNWVMTGKEQLI